ncbi:sialate O-acetylesterase [Mucilaginibacter paludis]|uniref:Sialate O-acetylesterase domain-containing protein n=1 Tax=Mucilaginibacter paludis DSM 18603 TaxID=714943 RepID=H1YFU1_9SPHI|nr:sialate O-acetylesterase [Mucilaginibacter paludis]EHQ25332.1 protein of unknown function DUF303 acetylesterase [Mucilaginibacter paludis DSM 18603]
MNKLRLAYFILIFTIFYAIPVKAQVRLPQLISDGMVLQRDTKLKIWGWASPGESITIKFNNRRLSTKTSSAGQWQVTLPETKAGGPYQMEIIGRNRIVLKDILVGDVWFCSGQSNMTIKMERVKEKYPEEIATANFPNIRYFFVPTLADVDQVHQDLPPGSWVSTTKEHILDIGAVAYFFSKQLYARYGVPIGIINSSVGGTPIQAWIGENGIKNINDYAKRLEMFKDTALMNRMVRPERPIGAATRTALATDKGLAGDVKWYDPAYEPKNWHKFWLPGYWADQGVKDLNGIVWFRKEINIPAGMAGKPAKLFLGRIIDADETYVNGKEIGNITYQYPPRRYEIPAGLLKEGKNVITVRITNTSGKGGFVPEKRYELTDGKTTIDLRGDWQYQVGLVYPPFRGFRGAGNGPPFSAQNEPTGLYNTMIAPAVNFAVKGFIWYQGEANIGTRNYGELLDTLINSWRSDWKQGNLPFLIVQLPNYAEVQYSPSESAWAEIREAQRQALALPATAMAVTIDVGEWNDIHPLDKKDVGERLALAAQKLAYGDAKNTSSGPLFRSAEIRGNQIILSFADIGGGLASKDGEPLNQFAISGSDKRFVWAKARIEGDKVIVYSPEVDHPQYVRYAWADNPEGANLSNKEGLPASPFRTDKP